MNNTIRNAILIQDSGIAKEPLIQGLKNCGITEVTTWSPQFMKADFIPKNLGLVVYSCNILDSKHFNSLFNLEKFNFKCKVLIMARQISIGVYRRLHKVPNFITLQIPCNPKLFEKLTKELIFNVNYKLQRSPRFLTNEPARVLIMASGLLLNTRLRNYSSAGAFLEYNGISLKIGDILKVNLNDNTNSGRRENDLIDAKVVWVQDQNAKKDSVRGVGVTFEI